VTAGRDDEAKRILADLAGVEYGDEGVEKEWREIREVVDADVSWPVDLLSFKGWERWWGIWKEEVRGEARRRKSRLST
jgi:hypothetical protein